MSPAGVSRGSALLGELTLGQGLPDHVHEHIVDDTGGDFHE